MSFADDLKPVLADQGHLLCSGCHVKKPKTEFAKRSARPRGYQSRCKACCKGYRDPAKEASVKRAYRAKNKLRIKAYNDNWRAANISRWRELSAGWRRRNPDKVRAQTQKRRATIRGAQVVEVSAELIRGRFDVYGNACAYCGGTGNLHADHVKPLALGGMHIPANIRPACAQCNLKKAATPPFEWLDRVSCR